PLSIMQMNVPGYKDIWTSLTKLAIVMCLRDFARNGDQVVAWFSSNLFNYPIESTAHTFRLLCLLGVHSEWLAVTNLSSALQVIFNRATEGLLTSPDGYSHVARLLNHIAMLTDPRSDDPLSFGKSGFTARKSVIFEILAFYIPRLA